jgi:hypothetical protein
MKRIISVYVSVLLIVFTVIISSAIKIDGYDDGLEWQLYNADIEVDGLHGNNVCYAAMKHKYLNEYELCIFLYAADDLSSKTDGFGFIVDIFDDLKIKVSDKGTEINGNSLKYSVESKMVRLDGNASSCEIIVGFKYGLPEKIIGNVSFIDGEGNNSYFYPFNFTSVSEDVTQAFTTKPIKTTKAEKSTKPMTTSKKNSTTKPENTTKDKTIQKITEAKKPNKTVVYFYEKEVIVSLVTEAELSQTPIATEKGIQQENKVYSYEYESDYSTGVIAQRIIVGIGIIALVVSGAIAGMSIKKSKTSENVNNESDSED